MDMLMLTSAIIAALGGVMALAFRVVRLPMGKPSARPATTRKQAAKVDPREPTQVLLIHVTGEYKRHTQALREALDLRRARSDAEAFTRLLNERVLHMEAARKLGQFVQPTVGGRFRQWFDQARLDLMVDTVRREVAEVRHPAGQTQPLAGERAFSRFITWMRGGPEVGAPQELVVYHREQRQHARMAMTEARRIVRERRIADAQARLAVEQAYHLRMSRSLRRQVQGSDGADSFGVTDPTLTAILN